MKHNRVVRNSGISTIFIFLLVVMLLINPLNLPLVMKATEYDDPAAVPFTFEILNTTAAVGETLELIYTPIADGLTDVKITVPSNLTYLWGTWNESDVEEALSEAIIDENASIEEQPSAEPLPEETVIDENAPIEEQPSAEPLPEETVINEDASIEEQPSAEPLPGEEVTGENASDEQAVSDEDMADGEIIIEDPLIALASFRDLLASNAGVIINDGSVIAVADWANLPGSCIKLSFRVDGEANTTLSVQGTLNGESVTADVEAQITSSSLEGDLTGSLPISNYECTTHTLKWSNAPGLVGNTLSLTPVQNTQQSAKVQINYSFGGIMSALPGEIKIRVPRYVFYDRSGAPIDSLDLSALPTLAQAQSGIVTDTVSFCYYYEDNDIVITNFRTFEAGTFTCEYAYLYMPYLVCDGYTKSDIQASFIYKHVSAGEGDFDAEVTSNSELLTVNVTTIARFLSINNSFYAKSETWQSNWGATPADATNYFYVTWRVTGNYASNCTQPYTMTLVDDPGAYGELVLNTPYLTYPFTFDGGTNVGEALFDKIPYPDYGTEAYFSRYIVVRYPRALVSGDTPVTQFTNTATLRLQGTDGAYMEKSISTIYNYQYINFTYVGDLYKPTKNTNGVYQYGAINALENTDTPAFARGSMKFFCGTTSRGWNLTNDGTDFNRKNYTVDVVDDLLYLGGERLQPEDYTMTTIGTSNNCYSEYYADINPLSGLTEKESFDYANYKPLIVYCKTRNNDSWQEIGVIRRTDLYACSLTPTGGVTRNFSSTDKLPLPDGAIAVKFSHTGNDYSYTVNMNVNVQINPTAHVLSLISNQDSVRLYNVDTLLVYDSDNILVNGNQQDITIVATVKSDIIARDTSKYGSIVQHASAYTDLMRFNTYSSMSISAGTQVSDPTTRRIEVKYTVKQYDAIQQNYFSVQDILDYGYMKEQTNGVFYNLLPPGTTVNLSTLRVKKYANLDPIVVDCPYTVRFVENWQGSGQTMMIVEAKFPDGLRNVYSPNTTNLTDVATVVYSGFTMEYTLLYPWTAYQDYGTPILNSVAYRSHAGQLSDGKTASSTSLTKKLYFSSLEDENGYADDTNRNTIYAQVSTAVNQLVTAELGLSMSVKGAGDMAYADTAEVPGGGTYTYRLRYGNSIDMTSQNLILYDVLEEANPNITDRWYGSLVSIDVSQAQGKGIAPVIYYSTVAFPDGDLPLYKDVTDAGIWSVTPPADLASVTAVAIDLSKKTNGTDYIFQPKETVYCYITMRTPDDYEEYLSPTIYAYNRPYYSSTALIGDPHDTCEGGAIVSVSLRQPDITLNKTSNPPGCTQDAPSPINPGGSLVYTLTVANTNMAENLTDIEITDIIPVGLAINYGNIHSSLGAASALSLPNARVSVTQDGQKLVFTISKLIAGEQLSLSIPCVVAAESGDLENTAAITKVGGRSFWVESPTLYHTINNTDIILRKTVNGRVPGDSIFTFELKDGDNTIAMATNNENGVVLFPIPNTLPGSYTYTVSEVNNAEGGISYDPAIYTIDVIITDFYGVIVPYVIYSNDLGNTLSEIVFENEYNLTPITAALQAKKTLTGKALAANMFSFMAKDNDSNTEYAAVNQSDGSITFSIPYDSPGQYTYSVCEIPGGPGEGVTYDSTVFAAVVTVTDNGDGTMTATPSYPDGEITFANVYTTADAEVTLTAKKTLNGANLEAGMFGFVVASNAGQEVAAATNKADGTVTFSPIRFSAPGSYTYTVSELDGGMHNIVYDKTAYTITVTVTDDEHGALSATVVLPNGGLLFTNEYVEDRTDDPDSPIEPEDPLVNPVGPIEPEDPPVNPVGPIEPEDPPVNPDDQDGPNDPAPDEPLPSEPPISPSNDHTYIYDSQNDQYEVYTRDGESRGHIQYPALTHQFIYDSYRDQYSVIDKQGELIGYVVLTGDQSPEDVILDEDLIPLGTTQFDIEPPSNDPVKTNPKTSDSIVYVTVYAGIAFLLTGLVFLLGARFRRVK